MTDDYSKRRDGVTIPTIWIAVALSVLLHIAVMWKYLPDLKLPSPELDKRGDSKGAISVQLAPPPRPPSASPSAPSVEVQPTPPPKARVAPPPPRPSAPVLALRTPSPAAPTAPPPAPPAPPPEPLRPQPQVSGDFASMVEARRRARGEMPTPPSAGSTSSAPREEDENARANRLAAANLATRRQTFGYDPTQGGGVFQLVRVGYSDASFYFFGWNREIKRNIKQLIEVEKGNNPDMRIAVIRKMIAIIRDYEQQDFLWESRRLERSVTLSARPRDNAQLEQFLMLEFFEDPLRPPPIR